MVHILSILVSHESHNPKGFQKVPGAPKSRSAQGLCVCSHRSHGMHGLMGEIHATATIAWWNESVCFKHPKEPTGLRKTGNQNWKSYAAQVRQDTAEARQCKKGRFWFYPCMGSRRAQQVKARRGQPLNSISDSPEEYEGCRPNQSVWSLL